MPAIAFRPALTFRAISALEARRIALRIAAGVVMLASLAGCQTTSRTGSAIETGSIARADTIDPAYAGGGRRRASGEDPLVDYAREAADIAVENGQLYGATAHLARVFESDPSDRSVAALLARHLRYLGATSEAEQVVAEARQHHPDDALLRLEQAKARIAGGKAEEAIALLEPLSRERPNDPAVLQALGVAYDRTGRHREAQDAYRAAIDRGRPSAALLNNYGLSHLLDGDLEGAIRILREASVAPGAAPQVRLNLAMALALAGEGAEARQIARSAAPRDAADQMVAYFEGLAASGLGPADAWSAAQQ